MDYIIVQAGGKGTRLKHLTKNKPKALVPVENLPMLFHLFRKYPDKRFIVIADYQHKVMRRYLECFAQVKYLVVDAEGTGTASGIRQAVEFIPEGQPFMLVWSDLILPDDYALPPDYSAPGIPTADYIGISETFPCRWKYENGYFTEEPSSEHGVAGFFLFTDRSKLLGLPDSGELVRWMQERQFIFKETGLGGTREFGLIEEYEKLEAERTRPFNHIEKRNDHLIKCPLDKQGEELALRERNWYKKARELGIKGIPEIYGFEPLEMEYIQGKNIYEVSLPLDEKRQILEKLIEILKDLHRADYAPADAFSTKEAYFTKTMRRIERIRNLVPLAEKEMIRVNGRDCRNVFFCRDELEMALEKMTCSEFRFIHGDCTFSNLMLKESGDPILIDPRGYFGHTAFFGDERYDWAKLYYSVVGNYDSFNLKMFTLDIEEDEIRLDITSNGWEDLEEDFFRLTGADREDIRLLHAVIWLSLSTYAWQDYDSVCGAFYNGLYYLEEALQ